VALADLQIEGTEREGWPFLFSLYLIFNFHNNVNGSGSLITFFFIIIIKFVGEEKKEGNFPLCLFSLFRLRGGSNL
jgi:hypothetical protein